MIVNTLYNEFLMFEINSITIIIINYLFQPFNIHCTVY